MGVTLITGASSGLGEGMARRLVQDGEAVALVARRADRLEGLAEELRAKGGKALVVAADVAERAAVHEAVQKTQDALGPITRLIANAGVSEHQAAADFDASDFGRILQINVMGAAYAVEAVLPSMVAAGKGHLVAISSLAAYRGLPGSAAYCASKAALTALFESLRIELTPQGVAVSVIHPGFVKTAMTDKNSFQMPFLMDLDPALDLMMDAINHQRPILSFPWPMALAVRVARLLPAAVYDQLVRSQKRPK